MMSDRARLVILLLVVVVTIGGVMLLPPIAQDLAYHQFADSRALWGIPHFWNVVTNLPFAAVGLYGLVITLRAGTGVAAGDLRVAHVVFFSGLVLIGAGSAYYHLEPTNPSLFWDRLAMSVSFMAFLSIVVGQHIGLRAGRLLLWPLLVVGAASVWWWRLSELAGQGDLRPYALVQFLPLLLIPLILVLYRRPDIDARWTWGVLAAYALSKVAEISDTFVYEQLGVMSGHSLKHLCGAAAAALVMAGALADKQRTSCGLATRRARHDRQEQQ